MIEYSPLKHFILNTIKLNGSSYKTVASGHTLKNNKTDEENNTRALKNIEILLKRR